jgi:hypothetical protein
MFWRLRDSLPSHVAIGAALVVLVAVDATVAGTRDASDTPHYVAPTPAPHAARRHAGLLPGVTVESVTSGGGRIWALVDKPSARGDRMFVFQLDPTDYRVTATVRVPGPADRVYYGAGRVWVSGGGDGGSPNVRISAFAPSVGDVVSLRLGSNAAVDSIAFHGRTGYAAVAGRDEVLALHAGRRLRVERRQELGGPTGVVAVEGAVQVTNASRNLVPIILRGADTSFLAEVSRIHPVLAAAGKRAVWVRSGHGLIRVSVTRGGVVTRKHVRTIHRVFEVRAAPGGGCYVSVTNRRNLRTHRNLLYFSPAALRSPHPAPTAIHHGREVNSLALNPAGGVVYVDNMGKLWDWVPRSSAR